MSFRESFVKFPLIGGLAYCRWNDLWRTFEEIIPKFIIAALPIVISAFVLRFVGEQHIFFPANVTKNFENGELYLFCTSMLSTIFYIAVRDRGGDEEGEGKKPGFPNKITHLLFVLVMIVGSSIVFAFKRAGVLLDPMLLVDLSYYFFIATFLMVVLATTINNGLSSPNPITFQKRETDDFLNRFRKHREPK